MDSKIYSLVITSILALL